MCFVAEVSTLLIKYPMDKQYNDYHHYYVTPVCSFSLFHKLSRHHSNKKCFTFVKDRIVLSVSEKTSAEFPGKPKKSAAFTILQIVEDLWNLLFQPHSLARHHYPLNCHLNGIFYRCRPPEGRPFYVAFHFLWVFMFTKLPTDSCALC